MDKKQINPELKQIYDRIMTTPTKPPLTKTGQNTASSQSVSNVPRVQNNQLSTQQPNQNPLPIVTQPKNNPVATQSTNPVSANNTIPTPSINSQTPHLANERSNMPSSWGSSNTTSFSQIGTYIPPVNIPPPLPNTPEVPPQPMPSIPLKSLKNNSGPIIFSSTNKSKNTVKIGSPSDSKISGGQKKSTNIIGFLIGMLVIVFLIAYSVFWLIFFGIITI